jgi:hypothetical protein
MIAYGLRIKSVAFESGRLRNSSLKDSGLSPGYLSE